jgi:hypothetical protein
VGSLTLLTVGNNLAPLVDLNDAIDKAGRRRMLSQRVAKAYLAGGQGVATQRAGEILVAAMALFDRQLVQLKAFARTPDVKATFRELEVPWGDYQAVLVSDGARERNGACVSTARCWRWQTKAHRSLSRCPASHWASGRLVSTSRGAIACRRSGWRSSILQWPEGASPQRPGRAGQGARRVRVCAGRARQCS